MTLRPVLLALALVLPVAAPAQAQVTPLAPDDGSSFTAGTQPTFRVQAPAGETVFIAISRSSAVADHLSCTRVDTDAQPWTFTETSTPGVFEATPAIYATYDFWMNRAGTYYWQAYYYESGCHVSAIRAINVTGVRPIEIGPQPLDPADGATLAPGPVTVRVSALAEDTPDYVVVLVSKSPQRGSNGVIGHDAQIAQLAKTADPTVWSTTLSAPWSTTPGTYYWQPYRISYFGDPDGAVEGPVRTLTIQPQTIRGEQAFTVGTPNDLYLACTKLDLWLVDVLPAGKKVSILGAADLRLRGQTAEIRLDGKRVGSAVIGSDGAFRATVRAPSKARRARARYQARVGTTVSQNLRLERRMVNAGLAARGNLITLSGRITKPFAKRADTIRIQRYRACGVKDTVKVKTVRPDRVGRFKVTFARPAASVRAMLFRATTKVAGSPGGRAKVLSFTLPRAISVGR